MIKVKTNWWKRFFNHIYLITDARSVCNRRLTAREVDLLEKTLHLKKADVILDLCGGQGRHSIELARRGYKDLTVLDYSDYLLSLGKKTAKQASLKINFYRGDARSTNLPKGHYSTVIVMAGSFGYFTDHTQNLRVLKEISRLLKNKGKLFIDLADAEYIRNNLEPVSWHKIGDDIEVFRRREIKNNLIKTREIALSGSRGLLRDQGYCIQLYSKSRISRMLQKAGFKNIKIRSNLSLYAKKRDYGSLTSRMIITAIKSGDGSL